MRSPLRRIAPAVILAAAAAVLAGCGDDGSTAAGTATSPPSTGAATTSTAAPATSTTTAGGDGTWLVPTVDAGRDTAGAPALLVTNGEEVRRVADGEVRVAGTVDGGAGVAVGDGDGTVVVERLRAAGDGGRISVGLVRLSAGKAAPLELPDGEEVHLYDAVRIDGRPHVLYGVRRAGDEETSGEVVLHDLDRDTTSTVTDAFGPEFFTLRVSAAARTLVASAITDLTESISFYRYDGTEVPDWPSPSDSLPYNMPPFLTDAVLAPDGDALAYLAGPDGDGATGERRGSWDLIVVGRDGAERYRRTLAGTDAELIRLDFDGRWAVVSSAGPDGVARSPLLVDTTAPDEPARSVSAIRGTATFDTAAARR